jgi:hypothetical protein
VLSPLSTPVSRKVTSGSLHRARTVRSALCLGWLALSLGLAGCPGGPDGPLRQFEVGTGLSFTPIEEGSTLELNSGGQGSQHVFVSLRVWELTSVKAKVKMSLERVSDGERLSAPYSVNLRFDQALREGEPAKLEGLLLVVDDPFEAVDREVRLNASFESDDGEHGSDSRTGTLHWAETTFP